MATHSQMNLDAAALDLLKQVSETLQSGFEHLPEVNSRIEIEVLHPILEQAARQLRNNFPYHHPLYLGQMLKPPHPVAHLAYTLAMCINPNNHAHDGGRASSAMEKESVAQLANMFGWQNALGHLTGGGTIANLEAHWVWRETPHTFHKKSPGAIVASSQAHYTHKRCASLLGLPFETIAVDQYGRLDINNLQTKLKQGNINTVVATCGTTGVGAVDPLDQILELRDEYQFRQHVDAAYGGYFKLIEDKLEDAGNQFALIHEADSIVIDPHKHGLQPYGCGCILFRDPTVAKVYKHDSPYTYFTSDDLHLGEISFECSRAGAAAVALWATMHHLPLTTDGEFATNLRKSRTAAVKLYEWLSDSERFTPILKPELDIVTWAVNETSASSSSAQARKIFETAAQHDLHLALLTVPQSLAENKGIIDNWDQPTLTCLRACLMKPEHLDWLPTIFEKLTIVADAR